jgi:hypothetical protein
VTGAARPALGEGPFAAAGRAPLLTAAYDELIGPGRWSPLVDVGSAVAVRFPSPGRANAGYHIESSYPGPAGQRGWVNVRSRGRGLLALFLFTDVGPDDARQPDGFRAAFRLTPRCRWSARC